MKTIFITFTLLLFSFCLKAQNDENISLGKKEVITSKVLNENRTLWVYTPNFTSQNPDPEKRYPVLYLLDGGAHFYSTVGIVQQLSQANGNGALPEMIVVAIENTNRVRDFIPSNNLDKPNPFIDFLSSELIPHIDRNYKTAPSIPRKIQHICKPHNPTLDQSLQKSCFLADTPPEFLKNRGSIDSSLIFLYFCQNMTRK